MYAVIQSGGKQYRVELGTELAVDRLDVRPGETIQFDQVLLIAGDEDPAVGRPHVPGATVSAAVLRQERGDKVVVFKYRPKARHRSKSGARAELTVLRISDIVYGGRSAATQAEAARTERQRLEAAAAEAAAKQAEADKALARKLARARADETAKRAPEAAKGKAETAKGSPATESGGRGRGRRASEAGTAAAPAPKAKAAPASKSAATGAKPETGSTPRAKVTGPKAEAEAKPRKTTSSRTQAPQPPKPGRARTKKDQ
jgi:large subunit ribosomal protein L21